MLRYGVVSAFLTASLLTSCGREAATPVETTARDSAGIRIIDNVAPRWGSEAEWRIAETPTVDIGVLDGDPEYQLFRVSGITRLSDGRIVIANSGTHELRYYDSVGGHLLSSGHEGSGPGEFQQLFGVWRLPHDSIMAYDFSNRRASVFDPDGSFARSISLDPSNESFPSLDGVFDDGSLLVRMRSLGMRDIEPGRRRDTVTYMHLSRQGEEMDTIGRLPGFEGYVRTIERPGMSRMMFQPILFGRGTVTTVRGFEVLVGTGDAYEIIAYGADGRVREVIRRAQDPVPVTDDDADTYVRRLLESIEDEERRREAASEWEDAPFSETLLPYQQFRADPDGNLWVLEYATPDEFVDALFGASEHSDRWAVFDPAGIWLGYVEMPTGLRVREIGTDYVLGTWQDEFEIEHVQIYELIKS